MNPYNNSNVVSTDVRQEIQDTLLLPITEIDKYKTKHRHLEQ